MAIHPSKDELSAFLFGKLPLDKCDDVASHIEICPPCQETVNQLETEPDTLMDSLRRSSEPAPIDSACQRALERAVTFVGGSADSPSITESVAGKSAEHDTQHGQAASAQPDNSMPDFSVSAVSNDAPKIPTAAEIVANLKAANLLSDDDWSSIQPDIAAATDGMVLIKRLLERGTLTKFQAQLVYQGKIRGLAFGEYIVLDRIGAGGMGQVFKARHRRMDRLVALKIMASAAMKDQEAVKRFQREAKAAAKLNHPNIVTAYDAGENAGVHFLVMEFVDGHDLSGYIKEHGPLPVPQAVDAILQAARGLAFAHAEGVVHRDIKPANLLRDKKGVVRVLDMGLARFDDPLGKGKDDGLTSSGAVMGTVDYMAPEQAFNTRDAGPAADVYSLGCTLYRLLTGQSLYNGETVVQKILAHREQAIPSLSSGSQTIPAALEKLYERMVAKKLEDRPTMVEIVQELERIARGELSAKIVIDTQKAANASRTAARLTSSGRSGNRPPVKWLAAAAGAAALLFFGVWVIIRDKDGNEVARIKAPDGSTVTTQLDTATKPMPANPPLTQPAPATVATSSAPQPALPAPLPTTKPADSGDAGNDLPPWTLAKDAPPPALAPLTPDAAKQLQATWAKYLGRKVVQENSLGMPLALIPPGEFDTVYTQPNEAVIKPELVRRRLRISQAFEFGTTEVTVAQFRRFVDATGYRTDAEKSGKGGAKADNDERKPEWTWKSPGSYKQTDDMPVVQVSWNDAAAFCEWLSKQEGARYRLPTEAEWELACRAGSESYHAVCEKLHELTQHAWVKENGSQGGAFVRPVGNWQANAWGLFDVLGNAWEWCADGGDRGSAEYTHPVDPWGYFFYPNIRGCGFDVPAKDAHPAYRRTRGYDLPRSSIGFRVLRQVSPDAPPGPLDRPLLVSRNKQIFRDALVASPAAIPGLRSWSVELAGCGHSKGSTQAVVWSPTGDRIATSHGDSVARLWDRNGSLMQVLARHAEGIPRMTFSPDGKWLVTVGASGGVSQYLIWNAATGACHAVVANSMSGRPTFSPDGTMLAVVRGSAATFQTLDLNTGRILGFAGGIGGTGGGAAGDYIAWSPDGKTIATVDVKDSISFHTAPGLERSERLPVAKKLYMLAWSPDGKWLAAAETDADRNVFVYDAETRTLKTTMNRELDRGLSSLTWSKDCRRLLEGGSFDRFFIIWDALTGDELLRSTGGGGPAAWSPDEQEVAVGGTTAQIFDGQTGLLKRSGIDVGRSVGKYGGPQMIGTDGERLFIREGLTKNAITILNAQTGVLMDRWEKLPSGSLALSPLKDQLAVFGNSIDKNLFLMDAATGKTLRELKPHPQEIRTVAWSPDGQQLASGGKDKILRIWNVADAKLQHELPGHEAEIFALAWSPDGKQLASADTGSVRLWDSVKGSSLAKHQAPGKLRMSAATLAWVPDSQALWLSQESQPLGAIKLDAALGTWSKPVPGVTVSEFFPSPNFRHWLLGVSNASSMYRRDEATLTGSFLKTSFRGCNWHPDARRFVGDMNGTGWIRGYDIEADQPLGVVMPAIIGNNWLVVGPEGHYHGPKGIEDHLIYIGQTETGEHITLRPAEFQQRFGWKNDPAQARLLGPSTTPDRPIAETPKVSARVDSPATSAVAAPNATITQAADGSFDLLKLLDLSRDVHAGGWQADGTAIVSAATENSLFEVPTSIPREYQLTLTVRRSAGALGGKGLLIGLPVAGQRVDAGIDVAGGSTAGLSDVEGVASDRPENPTRVKSPRPLIDGPNVRTIVCTVRPPSIQVSVDGKTIIDFAEPALLNSNRMTRLFDSLYLDTETAMRIERLEIKSLQTADRWQPRVNRERLFPPTGLAAAPAELKGVGRWQVDTVGTRSNLNCVAISPDGKHVACGNDHGQIRIYDPETWRLVRCWTAHLVRKFYAVNSLAWSPDGTQIASAGTHGLCLWQPDGTLLAIRSLGPTADVRDPRVCWSPDGSRLAVGSFDSWIRIFDRDGTVGPTFNIKKGAIQDLCFSPDGQQLVYAAGNNNSHIINLDGSSGPELVGQDGVVRNVSWSKRGQIATVSTDKTLRLWESDGKPGPVVRNLVQGNGTLRFVRWSPDGTRLLVGDNSPLLVVSPTGEVLAKESHGGKNLGGVVWSADGQRVAYVSNFGAVGSHPGIWDLTGKPWNMPEYQPVPHKLTWSPDGRHLAMSTQNGGKARIIRADGTVITPPFPVGRGFVDFAWSPDSKRLALTQEKSIRLFDVSDSSIVASPTVLNAGADLVRWSPDGRLWASRGGDKTMRLWNSDGTPGPVLKTESGSGALAWLTADTLIAGDVDGNKKTVLQQWKIDGTKGPTWPISRGSAHASVSPDRTKILVNGGNSGLMQLDLAGKELLLVGGGTGNGSWSQDGKQWLLTTYNNHGSAVRLMDTASNKPIHVFPFFEPRVSELSSTGVIAACSSDYTVRAWDSATARPLWTTVCLNDDQSVTLAADGRVLQSSDVKLDDVLFYSVERDDGRVDTLTYSEFVKLAPDYTRTLPSTD